MAQRVSRPAVEAAASVPAAFTPKSFAQATDIADFVQRRRRIRRSVIGWKIFITVVLVAAAVIGSYPFVLQYQADQQNAALTAARTAEVNGWPAVRIESSFKSARAYNARLAASGQTSLGQVAPMQAALAGTTVTPGDSQAQSNPSTPEETAAAKINDEATNGDAEYKSLLDTGDGVMGTIRVPKVSIKLPIYHGTSKAALDAGAGHLYGTSLPVGGASTHAVLTGHRGLVEALMFTRLDEMAKGDMFYIDVLGETLAYKVDRISVILPDDVSQLKVTKGEDRVTLMTCTPYGINTHRLLVSGVRVPLPSTPAPAQVDVRQAAINGGVVAVAVVVIGWVCAAIPGRRRGRHLMMHASFWPRGW